MVFSPSPLAPPFAPARSLDRVHLNRLDCLPSGARSVSSRQQLFCVLDIPTGTGFLALKAAQRPTASETLPQQLPVELEGDLSNPRRPGSANNPKAP